MKKILVTGISRGIGEAIARKLASNGYFIYGTYKSSKKEAQELKKEIKNIKIFQVDLSNRKQTLNLINKLKGVQFDGLINNAGIIEFEAFDKLRYENWDKVLEVNLSAPFILAHGLRKSFNKDAVIVNITSTDGMTGAFVSMSYSASKAALINLTKSLGNVFAKQGVRVVGIAPGWIGGGVDSPIIKGAVQMIPLGRNGTTEEIANVVSFVLSKEASFINGQTIIVDGGYTNVEYMLKKEAEKIEKQQTT